MTQEQLYNELVTEFNLTDLPEEDREDMLLEVAKTIQKQFLIEVYDRIGEQQFNALQASASMGEEFYTTTLKHLVPDCEEIFIQARKKVVKAFSSS
ncbi:MAG: hypothetical protein RLZZ308_89 [Candidatus Parcubacteria bacterium]|jgi:hypothetical protein